MKKFKLKNVSVSSSCSLISSLCVGKCVCTFDIVADLIVTTRSMQLKHTRLVASLALNDVTY